MEGRIDFKCEKCDIVDHDENHFCRCEGRNIQLAKQHRQDGISPWKKPLRNEFIAKDEADFVNIFLNTKGPFTIFVPDDFDYEKMCTISKENGICFVNTYIDNTEKAICLPSNPNSEQVSDSNVLRIRWQGKD